MSKALNKGTKVFTTPSRANQPSCNETLEFILALLTQYSLCMLVVKLKGPGKNETHPVAVLMITEWRQENKRRNPRRQN